MKNSRISWTDHTHNHWIGCTKIRPGCDHCYACADFCDRKHVVTWGRGHPRHLTTKSNRLRPLRWNEEAKRIGIRPRVFCSSLSDVFDLEAPHEWRMDLFTVIRRTPHLDWMLLTKRPAAMDAWFQKFPDPEWPWSHVALGVSIENDEYEYHGNSLAQIPAARRFVSIEPLIGPVDCSSWIAGVDEVIVGGESGKHARALDPDWIRAIRDTCQAAGKTFVFKQWGDANPGPLRSEYLAAGWDPEQWRGGRFLDSTLWLGEKENDPQYVSREFAKLGMGGMS